MQGVSQYFETQYPFRFQDSTQPATRPAAMPAMDPPAKQDTVSFLTNYTVMTRVTLLLNDAEFLELGGLAWGYFAAGVQPEQLENAFGSLLNKIKEKVTEKATPGQLLHLEKVARLILSAAASNTVDMMMIKDGFDGLITTMEENLDG